MKSIDKKRHIMKSLTWRVIASSVTFLLTLFLFGSVNKASAAMVFDVFLKTILYYIHERVWYKTKWGVKDE